MGRGLALSFATHNSLSNQVAGAESPKLQVDQPGEYSLRLSEGRRPIRLRLDFPARSVQRKREDMTKDHIKSAAEANCSA